MLTAILTLASLVLSGAFSHGKSAQKVQTMDLSLDESAGEGCSSFWDRCGDGLSCSTTTKTCVPYATRNEACGDSAGGIDCVDNYWCLLGIGSGYTCSSGAQGDACSKQNFPHSCNGDLSCLSNGMCGTNVGPGDACGTSAGNVDCVAGYWCSKGIGSGYTCSSGEKGEACSFFGESCKSGLSCLSDGMCGFKNAIGNGEYQSCCIYWAKNDNFCTNAAGVKASDSDQVCGCESDFMTFVLKCNAANCTTTKASTSGKKCTYNSTLPYVKESKESDWDKGWDEFKAVATGIWEGADSVAVGLFDSIKEVGECVWDVELHQISGTDACDKLGKQLKDMVVDVGKCWLTTFDPVSGLANPLKPIDECPLYKDLAKAWTNCLDDSNPTTCIAKYTTIVALQVALAVGTAGTGVAAEATGEAVVTSEEAGTVGTDGTDIGDKPEAKESGCYRRHRLLLACKDAGCRAEVRRAHRKLTGNELTCMAKPTVLHKAIAQQLKNNIDDLFNANPEERFDDLGKQGSKSFTDFYDNDDDPDKDNDKDSALENDDAYDVSLVDENDDAYDVSLVDESFEMPLLSKDFNVDALFVLNTEAVVITRLSFFQRFLESIRKFLNMFKRTQRLSDDDPDKVNDKDSTLDARRLAVHEMDKGELTIDEFLLLNDIFGAFGSGMAQVSNYYSADRLRDLNTKLSLNGQNSGLEFTTYANPGNFAYSGVNELGSETASKIVLKAVELPGNAGKMILTASKIAASPLSGTPRPAVLATSNSTQD